ncbi:hypothetical protein E0500_028845 [Streptomyces sp. KM273126]|nr:hypothetical protein [Streptomyces sp. KM273126]
MHGLDDAGDSGGALGVADVGLHRAQQQGSFAVLAVCGEEGLGLDGVAQCRARAVCLDGVDLVGGEAGVVEGGADDALLCGPVGGADAVGGAVLVEGGTADHGEHGVAGSPGVAEAFQYEDAGALAPADPVGGGGEGLAAAVGGEAALGGEGHEGARGAHDGGAAGEGEGGLAGAQRLHGPVQGDEEEEQPVSTVTAGPSRPRTYEMRPEITPAAWPVVA